MAQIAGCSFTRIGSLQTQCGGDQKTRRREGRRRIAREGFLAIAGDFWKSPENLEIQESWCFLEISIGESSENLGTCGRGSSETACYFSPQTFKLFATARNQKVAKKKWRFVLNTSTLAARCLASFSFRSSSKFSFPPQMQSHFCVRHWPTTQRQSATTGPRQSTIISRSVVMMVMVVVYPRQFTIINTQQVSYSTQRLISDKMSIKREYDFCNNLCHSKLKSTLPAKLFVILAGAAVTGGAQKDRIVTKGCYLWRRHQSWHQRLLFTVATTAGKVFQISARKSPPASRLLSQKSLERGKW